MFNAKKNSHFYKEAKSDKLKERKVSNKLKTAGYTIKRLKDNGFVIFKMFNAYNQTDPRRWTVLINPGVDSIYLTCYHNKDNINEIMFEFDDGGNNFNRGFFVKTESVEVLVSTLIEKGISNDPADNPFSVTK
tara:strand:+ start:478 stop:876 length:399 start_codon:yes stop_codon:yes gene_type:complete